MEKDSIYSRIMSVLKENPQNGKILSSLDLQNMGLMSSATFSLIKNNKTNPKESTLLAFSKHFQVDLNWLMFGTGEKYLSESDILHADRATLLNKAYEEIRNLREQLKAKDEQIARLIDIIGGQTEKSRASESSTREVI